MIEFLLASENMPFTIALTVLIGIGLLEGVSVVIGFGISSFLESLFPDFDMNVPDTIETPSIMSTFLGWLGIGRVPALVLLLVFLTSFGLLGLALQSCIKSVTGHLAPSILVIWFPLISSFPLVRFSSRILGRFVIKDETSAVSEDSFIGLVATVSLGTAEQGKPAEAKLTDRFGQTHYLMVEPDLADEKFTATHTVLIVRRSGSVFKVIAAPVSMSEPHKSYSN